ncbi:hypothetical protein [Runella sp. SP2]|uniref:hypothetical protein n=1 Tax=Runella sp. SP2 TaxID=2268026 RepID=UPI000F07BC07|nr:hypothetical protein [Runella sp. SP2]AYQ33770.1 hypothetical protein DTQ70_17120 [Runella sp. SP2]
MDFRIPYFIILSIGSIVGIYRINSLTKSSKLFLLLLVTTFVIELASYFMGKILKNNLIIYNIYMPIYLNVFLYGIVADIKREKILWMGLFFLILWGLTYLYTGSIYKFNTLALQMSLIIQIIVSLVALFDLLKSDTLEPLIDFPLFWICSGFLIFSSANLIALGAYNYINRSEILVSIFQKLRIYSNYLLYILFLVSFMVKQNSIKK